MAGNVVQRKVKKFDNTGHRSETQLKYFIPDECPTCKGSINPVFVEGAVNIDSRTAYLLFECPKCHVGFIKTIFKVFNASGQVAEEREDSISSLAPNHPLPIEFPEVISEASEKFISIYNQANEAEVYGLDEIAGLGYRKALEFLLKDYLSFNLDDEDQKAIIRGKWLGEIIKEDIESQNIKAVAERAIWLGNDEAHYLRKWDTKDIQDLKTLIRLAVNWIENELLTQKYVQDMPDGKK